MDSNINIMFLSKSLLFLIVNIQYYQHVSSYRSKIAKPWFPLKNLYFVSFTAPEGIMK